MSLQYAKVTITFLPLDDKEICPVQRNANDREMSKAVHKIMDQAGIEKFYSVTSIRKASITQAIQQGASQIQINRFSRLADGTSTETWNFERMSLEIKGKLWFIWM
ncbi:MAG: hypothetical protein EZS28_047293, partial [Streblomastix strix]